MYLDEKQLQNVIKLIAEYRKLNLSELIAKKYSSNPNPLTITIGSFSAMNFILLSQRAIEILSREIEDGLGPILAEKVNRLDDYDDAIYIESMLKEFILCIQNSDYEDAQAYLKEIIEYLKYSGLWGPANQTVSSSINITKTEAEIKLVQEHLKETISKNIDLINSINETRKSLEEFRDSKTKELSVIQGKLESLSKNWDDLYKNASVTDVEINNIYKNQKNRLEEINSEQITRKKLFDTFSNETTELEKQLDILISTTQDTLKEADKSLKHIEGKKAFMDEKEQEIIKLTGFAADSALGHSFRDRAKKLYNSSILWLVVIVLLTAGTGLWVYLVFTVLKSSTGNVWIDGIMNILKTIPAFIVLGFSVRQYSKERNLQEEYQFKQAVAVTLNAYADQLENETNQQRIALLRKTIAQLYTPPQITHDPGISIFRSKSTNEALKTISEAMTKIADVTSKK
jgi:hypothetical protein